MEIIITENNYTLVIKDISSIKWEDYVSFCKFINETNLSQSMDTEFIFSDSDISYMKEISNTQDEHRLHTGRKYFELIKKCILENSPILKFTNKSETFVAHKIVWFFQKKLVFAQKGEDRIYFDSQDFANFNYDLLKLSNHYKTHSSLKVQKNLYISPNKEKYLKKNPNIHYCDIIPTTQGKVTKYRLCAPLPIVYSIQ